jgi:hypothetical protein
MERCLQLLSEHLTRNQVHIEVAPAADHIWFYDQHGALQSRVCVDIIAGTMCLQMLLPVPVPKRRHAEMVRLMNGANSAIRLGAFSLDTDEGRICFRLNAEVDEEAVAPEALAAMFDRLVSLGRTMAGHFLPALMAVASTGQSAVRALAALEARRTMPQQKVDPELLDLNELAAN